MKKGIIFDMDGTLWDSIDEIVLSWNLALQEQGETRTVVTREGINDLMGQTMDKFAKALFPYLDSETGMQLLGKMMMRENSYLEEHGAVLLGDVRGVFEQLHGMGYGVYIVSNCQSGYIEAFLRHYDLESLVDDLECYGNTGYEKDENLKKLVERNGLEDYAYVGDTQGDHDACSRAGVPFIFASYGFGKVIQSVPTLDSLDSLIDFLRQRS